MVSFQVDAKVLVVKSHTVSKLPGTSSRNASLPAPPSPQDAVQSLDILHALFAAADTPSYSEERQKKRRKIETDRSACTHPVYFEDARSVILARVSIKLVGFSYHGLRPMELTIL